MKYSLLCLVLFSACGPTNVHVDAELSPYISRFEQDIGVDATFVSASFIKQDLPTLALCQSWTNGARQIQVDPTAWAAMNDLGREQLMYHELGHCAMDLQHENETVRTTGGYVYGSIMNQYWFGETWFYKVYNSNYKVALHFDRPMEP